MKKKSVKLTIGEAVDRLVIALRKDKDYYRSWQANIAMAYMDNHRWHTNSVRKKYVSRIDRHVIANNAANYFLDLLCGTPDGKTSKRNKQK